MYYIKLNITLSYFQKWEEESLWIADVFKDALISIGFDSFVDTTEGFEAYCSEENYCLDKVKQIAQENHTIPCASIASRTFKKPAILAPAT